MRMCADTGGMVRRFRFRKAHSDEMRSMSLIEGCSWSVLACNAVFSLLAKRILRLTPEVLVTFYIDDSKLRSRVAYQDQLEQAVHIFVALMILRTRNVTLVSAGPTARRCERNKWDAAFCHRVVSRCPIPLRLACCW